MYLVSFSLPNSTAIHQVISQPIANSKPNFLQAPVVVVVVAIIIIWESMQAILPIYLWFSSPFPLNPTSSQYYNYSSYFATNLISTSMHSLNPIISMFLSLYSTISPISTDSPQHYWSINSQYLHLEYPLGSTSQLAIMWVTHHCNQCLTRAN